MQRETHSHRHNLSELAFLVRCGKNVNPMPGDRTAQLSRFEAAEIFPSSPCAQTCENHRGCWTRQLSACLAIIWLLHLQVPAKLETPTSQIPLPTLSPGPPTALSAGWIRALLNVPPQNCPPPAGLPPPQYFTGPISVHPS